VIYLQNKLSKIATVTAILGFIMLGIALLTGNSYHNMNFRIEITVGFLLIFLSLLLKVIHFIREFFSVAKNKQHATAVLFFVLGIYVFISFMKK
jgi:hypothetical protein